MSQSEEGRKPLRVLVFGATGTGKTSLCNEVTGRDRPTGDGAKGITDRVHVYGQVSENGERIVLVDTVGLHEADTGTVPADRAVAHLVELLTRSRDGFNLLLHVAKAGRLTKQQQQDYAFFVDKLTQRRIPVLLVLTGCENSVPMNAWIEKNRDEYRPFLYRKLIATCFGKGGRLEREFAPLRAESRDAVMASVREFALLEPVLLYGSDTGNSFTQVLQRVWNDFVELAGLPAKMRMRVNESAYHLLKRLGVPQELAELAIKHLPELVEMTPVPGKPIVKKILRAVLRKLFGKAQTATVNSK